MKDELIRDDFNRWILQKNISDSTIFIEFLKVMDTHQNVIDYEKILKSSREKFSYRGRSEKGSSSTMGVRMSQLNFYMFGYKSTYIDEFIPTPISEELILGNLNQNLLFLGNLFMMQYPHPNSKTSYNVDLFFGRMLIKLLLDKRLDYKLYTDELIYIIPFVRSVSENSYTFLVEYILEYRNLSYGEKLDLFRKVPNYEAFFAKITHEMLYYFTRICESFGVFEIKEDQKHNEGKVFKFRQGSSKSSTFRSTSAYRRGKYQGYIVLNSELHDMSRLLLEQFPFFSETFKLGHSEILTTEELNNDMYIVQAYKLLSFIYPEKYKTVGIVEKLDNVRKYSMNSPDGKMFELSLYNLFKEFDESYSVDLQSGPGKTDVFCVFYINDKLKKFNLEAKSGVSGNNVNVQRIIRHMKKTNADYCLMVAPRFSRGTYLDIGSTNISTMTTETLYQYCMKMLSSSNFRKMPYYFIHQLAISYPGERLDFYIEDLLTNDFEF